MPGSRGRGEPAMRLGHHGGRAQARRHRRRAGGAREGQVGDVRRDGHGAGSAIRVPGRTRRRTRRPLYTGSAYRLRRRRVRACRMTSGAPMCGRAPQSQAASRGCPRHHRPRRPRSPPGARAPPPPPPAPSPRQDRGRRSRRARHASAASRSAAAELRRAEGREAPARRARELGQVAVAARRRRAPRGRRHWRRGSGRARRPRTSARHGGVARGQPRLVGRAHGARRRAAAQIASSSAIAWNISAQPRRARGARPRRRGAGGARPGRSRPAGAAPRAPACGRRHARRRGVPPRARRRGRCGPR